MTSTIYKIGRVVRQLHGRGGMASLFAQGTYAHVYRPGILYLNSHAPFFAFTEERAAVDFLMRVTERFPPTQRVAMWSAEARERWPCPPAVYLGYKRERWPAYWRAYQRLRAVRDEQEPTAESSCFSDVAAHSFVAEVHPGTVLCPSITLLECLSESCWSMHVSAGTT